MKFWKSIFPKETGFVWSNRVNTRVYSPPPPLLCPLPPPSSVLSFPLLSFPLLLSSLIKICLNCIYYYQCVNIFCTVHLTLSQSLLPHSQMKILFYKCFTLFLYVQHLQVSSFTSHAPFYIFLCGADNFLNLSSLPWPSVHFISIHECSEEPIFFRRFVIRWNR